MAKAKKTAKKNAKRSTKKKPPAKKRRPKTVTMTADEWNRGVRAQVGDYYEPFVKQLLGATEARAMRALCNDKESDDGQFVAVLLGLLRRAIGGGDHEEAAIRGIQLGALVERMDPGVLSEDAARKQILRDNAALATEKNQRDSKVRHAKILEEDDGLRHQYTDPKKRYEQIEKLHLTVPHPTELGKFTAEHGWQYRTIKDVCERRSCNS